MLLNFLLAWGAGLVILYFTWQLSMPARTFWMTGIAAICFAVGIITGVSSIAMMARRMRGPATSDPPVLWATGTQTFGLLIGGAALLWTSYQQTEGPIEHLASVNLSGENIVERPAGWLSYRDAKAEFRADWCRREFFKDAECKDLGDSERAFEDEFERRRKAALNDMRRPDWSLRTDDPTHMDLRGATLTNAFLSGANLFRAQMEGANLRGAQMEGAILWEAQMEGAVFDFSELTGTRSVINALRDTNLSRSINDGGLLRFVNMTETLFDAQTDFRNSFLDGSVKMTGRFRLQMGQEDGGVPCQWVLDRVLSDEDFYGHWRGWVEANPSPDFGDSWDFVGPDEHQDVAPIPPPTGCEWKTGPMPGAE